MPYPENAKPQLVPNLKSADCLEIGWDRKIQPCTLRCIFICQGQHSKQASVKAGESSAVY